jgi:hypothetical protein
MASRCRAVVLPFLQGQIEVAELVYDDALPAMRRASVYGLKSGALDFLITDADTYVLAGPHNSPTSARHWDHVCACRWRNG